MRRPFPGVNARGWRVAAASLPMLLATLLLVSCREDKADRLYLDAGRKVERGDLAGAVERYDRIIREYGDTPVAAKAKSDVVLYRGLLEASRRFPIRRVGDLLVQTARAVERFRGANGKCPGSLAELVPAYLSAEPVDPWGRPIAYRSKPGGGYRLGCLGADGAEGGDRENADLEVEDGRFVKGNPEGGP